MKELYECLSVLSENERICLFWTYKRYYKAVIPNYEKYDLFLSCICDLLEQRCSYENLPALEQIKTIFAVCGSCMAKYYKDIKHQRKLYSLDVSVGDKQDDKSLIDLFGIEDVYSFDIDLLKSLLILEIKKYEGKERQILIDSIIHNMSLSDLHKKYKMLNASLSKILRPFRNNFAQILVKNGFNIKYSIKNDDLVVSQTQKLSSKRKVAKRHNKDVSNFYLNDMYIYTLLRKMSRTEIADFLSIDIDYLDKILCHRTGSAKLYLYQIQALRNKYFPNFTLNKLCEVNENVCVG